MMNIKDIQQTNTDSNQTFQTRNKNYSEQNYGNNFSYYVESSKVPSAQNMQENNQEEQQNPIEELDNTENKNQNQNYAQILQTLNTELFNLGISENKSDKQNDDMFSMKMNLQDMTSDDIKLFENLAQKTELAVNSFNAEKQTVNMNINGDNFDVSYKSLEVSKTLMNAIENASQTGKPVRLDFGKDVSVILKISKDGKLSADFVPNDKAMEAMLKSALPQLKAKFDEENLPYNELNYRNFNQQKDNNKQQNKEKKKDE